MADKFFFLSPLKSLLALQFTKEFEKKNNVSYKVKAITGACSHHTVPDAAQKAKSVRNTSVLI